ncbi:MAG: hypothetical protein LE178_01305 [Endomicrobium sp.]|nr:hypothetical protein [Endomicrobium sp.]
MLIPISPHTLTQKPMILPSKSSISFIAKNKYSNRKIMVSIDRQGNYTLPSGAKIKFSIYKKSNSQRQKGHF